MDKVNELVIDKTPADKRDVLKADIDKASAGSGQKALASMAVFPLIMLICYIVIWFYFKSRGGYKPVTLGDEA